MEVNVYESKKIILAILLATSISSTFLVGCESYTIDNDKKVYTTTEVSKIKKDLSKKISKAIEDSGLRVAEVKPDGSFVLSLGNLEYSKEQPKQVLNYSMTLDKKKDKEILFIQCVKDYLKDEKLSKDDKFVKAIYNIYKFLTDTNITEKEFFNKVEKVVNKGEGIVELPDMGDVHISAKEIDKETKILELRFEDEFY
ncbi:putative lipoprotein [[Clostridium] sordellii ATCC 9714]|nr:putative lipoprotein [[Clostridium] sordellii ATCC 9714] [Paeniclostridium sordellii ATCC 9714]